MSALDKVWAAGAGMDGPDSVFWASPTLHRAWIVLLADRQPAVRLPAEAQPKMIGMRTMPIVLRICRLTKIVGIWHIANDPWQGRR
jgi:hypothetical protein